MFFLYLYLFCKYNFVKQCGDFNYINILYYYVMYITFYDFHISLSIMVNIMNLIIYSLLRLKYVLLILYKLNSSFYFFFTK